MRRALVPLDRMLAHQVDGIASACRFLRPRPRQPPRERHGPVQYPLLLLHAGKRRPLSRIAREILNFEEIERFVRIAVFARDLPSSASRAASRWCGAICRADPAPGGHPRHSRTWPSPPTASCCRNLPAALRSRIAPHQYPPGHARPRALPAHRAPRRPRQRIGRTEAAAAWATASS